MIRQSLKLKMGLALTLKGIEKSPIVHHKGGWLSRNGCQKSRKSVPNQVGRRGRQHLMSQILDWTQTRLGHVKFKSKVEPRNSGQRNSSIFLIFFKWPTCELLNYCSYNSDKNLGNKKPPLLPGSTVLRSQRERTAN